MDISNRNSNEIAGMFDRIAPRYDLLNKLLSLRTDRRWRRKVVKIAGGLVTPGRVLDVATGTADLAIEFLRLNPSKITGIDISGKMLSVGRSKIEERGLGDRIELIAGAAEEIPFENSSFDLTSVSFGVRNFSDPEKGLKEMQRVLRPGGYAIILEFSTPRNFMIRFFYSFYFNRVVPFLGRVVSGDSYAYRYLPESVSIFPEGDEFKSMMYRAGFANINLRHLSGGIATIYTGQKL